jgi:hypothetical protein
MARHVRFGLVAFIALLAGCAAETDGSDLDPGDPDEESGSSSSAQTTATCAGSDDALFFHGMHGYGRELGGGGICAPRLENAGANGFWSAAAFMKAPGAEVVGGYSAGRIPLVRRLASGRGMERTAVLLDGSWADGARFEGRTGPAIVKAWLEADPSRTFVLVYIPSSAGWREYQALASGPVASQVKVCAIRTTHLELPRVAGPKLMLDPEGWLAERCPTGSAR